MIVKYPDVIKRLLNCCRNFLSGKGNDCKNCTNCEPCKKLQDDISKK